MPENLLKNFLQTYWNHYDWFTLSVTSFSFIISRRYYLSSLIPVPTISLLSLFNWDSFGSDKQVLFLSTSSFTYCFSINLYKRLSKISLEISFSSQFLTNLKTLPFQHFLLLRLSVCMETMTSVSSSSFSIFSGGTCVYSSSIKLLLTGNCFSVDVSIKCFVTSLFTG